MAVRRDIGGYRRAVRQRDADPAGDPVRREHEDPVIRAEAPPQAVQVEALGFAWGGCGAGWKLFNIKLRKCARDIGDEMRPFGCGRCAEKLYRRRQMGVSI